MKNDVNTRPGAYEIPSYQLALALKRIAEKRGRN